MNQKETYRRCNNFNILRFIAAIMVMAGHMATIDGNNRSPALFDQGIHSIGVKIFFLLGGYLISKSWISDKNIFRYTLKRIMRIFPALIVYVIFAAFIVGPIISDLSVVEYYKNEGFCYYFRNIFMYPIYGLPGVFLDNPYAGVVNGSLWTLPVELCMYICIPIVYTIAGIKKEFSKTIIVGIAAVICVFQLLHLSVFSEWSCVIYGTDWAQAFTLIPFYFIGVLYSCIDLKKKYNLELAVILLMLYSCISVNLGVATNEMVSYIVLPYFVFSFGLCKEPYFSNAFNKYEISYGIYLYGFFIQQILVWICNKNNVILNSSVYLIISVAITCLIAFISHKYIEKPAQNICKYILKKYKNS